MCGRYVRTSSPVEVASRLGVDRVDDGALALGEPDYNVAPRQSVLVIREREQGGARERVLSALRWGLVPSWADDARIGDRQINARAETVAQRTGFADSFRKRRCVVVADGFYEWRAGAAGSRKQPMYFTSTDGQVLAFAGLWDAWRDPSVPEGQDPWLRSCLILTTGANAVVSLVHDRMPVILEPDSWAQWLDPRPCHPGQMTPLLQPAPADRLTCTAVGTAVNRATSNGPELVRPVALPPQQLSIG